MPKKKVTCYLDGDHVSGLKRPDEFMAVISILEKTDPLAHRNQHEDFVLMEFNELESRLPLRASEARMLGKSLIDVANEIDPLEDNE